MRSRVTVTPMLSRKERGAVSQTAQPPAYGLRAADKKLAQVRHRTRYFAAATQEVPSYRNLRGRRPMVWHSVAP